MELFRINTTIATADFRWEQMGSLKVRIKRILERKVNTIVLEAVRTLTTRSSPLPIVNVERVTSTRWWSLPTLGVEKMAKTGSRRIPSLPSQMKKTQYNSYIKTGQRNKDGTLGLF